MASFGAQCHSSTNRRYNYNLKICCHCQRIPTFFLQQVPEKVIQDVTEHTPSTDFRSFFLDSICILYVLCEHNVTFVKDQISTLSVGLSSRLILCTVSQSIANEDADVVFISKDANESQDDFSETILLRKIREILDYSKLYDDAGLTDIQPNQYDEQFMPYVGEGTRATYQSQENDHIYETLNNARISEVNTYSGQFVEATSMKPNKNGIQIRDELCLPKGNTAKDVSYVTNVILKSLKEDHYIEEIVNYLEQSDCDIINQVINILTEECFILPSAKGCEIVRVLDRIWVFLDKWKGDMIMVKSITLLSNLLVAKANLICLHNDHDKHELKQLLDNNLIPKIDSWLSKKAVDKHLRCFFLGSKVFMEDFVSLIKKEHRAIELGDWKASLRHEINQKNLMSRIKKMTVLEKVSTVLGLVSLKCDPAVHIRELPDLVQKACCDSFAKLRKQDTSVIYSYCILANRSLVFLIQRLKETEDCQAYTTAIETMLKHKIWTKEQRETLSQELWPLVMHASQMLRYKILNLLVACGNSDMGVLMRSYLQNKLRSGRLFITEEMQRYSHGKGHLHRPKWSDCKGVFGGTEVRMKILVPTKNCVAKGIDDKYKEQRMLKNNERFYNTMEILAHIQQNGTHENIATLLSYQMTQMPLFYAVQTDGAMNFMTFLLHRRSQKQWCGLNSLSRYIACAISALSYLHSQNIIHRDITACRFDVLPEHFRLKLSDFRLAKKLHRATDTLCLDDSGTLAVRWSAVESLQKDEFSIQSDTWMLSLFMYEVFTHGCWPYSELTGKETEDVMHMVMTKNYNQSQPRCIPDKAFKYILLCLDRRTDKRPTLQDMQKTVASFTADDDDNTEVKQNVYPKLLKQQKENKGQPELGVPPLIQQLKDRTVIYYNTKSRQVTVLPLRHEDLIADDEPDRNEDRSRGTITVSERLGTFSKTNNLPYYLRLRDINNIKTSRWEKIVEAGEIFLNYTYEHRGGETLIDHAFGTDSTDGLLRWLYRLCKLIKRFHENGWIVRCFSAKDIWITGRKKICLLRLGRACRLQTDTTGDGHVKDEPFQDRLNWLPLEVLRDNCFTKKSDVYMIAMVMYEVYEAVYFYKDNPLRNPILCVPFYMTPRVDLLDALQVGEVPKKPTYCPCSLYKLMKKCWSRDVVNRPTIVEILENLRDILRRKDFNADEDFVSESSVETEIDYSSFSESESDSDSEEEVDQAPQLPKRDIFLNRESMFLPNRPNSDVPDKVWNDTGTRSSSDYSFPDEFPNPLPFLRNSCSSDTSGSSYPASRNSDTDCIRNRPDPDKSLSSDISSGSNDSFPRDFPRRLLR